MDIKVTKSGKKYLKRKLKKCNKDYSEAEVKRVFSEMLAPYKDKIDEEYIFKIVDGDGLNGMSYSNFGKKLIHINGRFFFEYFVSDDKEFCRKCILQCVGHELGHGKAATFSSTFLFLATKKDKVKARLVEVFCDNYSKRFTGFDKNTIQRIMQEYIDREGKDITAYTHPKWSERIEYLNYTFTKLQKIINITMKRL